MANSKRLWLVWAVVLALVLGNGTWKVDASPHNRNPDLVRTFTDASGRQIDEMVISGRPPAVKAKVSSVLDAGTDADVNVLLNVPAFDWSYGCSPTSAAMLFGYYDNTGYPNMYVGPANGGVCPMTNALWGTGESPLSASHQGIDGRTTKGNVDDYWVAYQSTSADPYIGNWEEHSPSDCTADFMGTNQSKYDNSDGSTRFYYWTDSGAPLYDYELPPSYVDGCRGLRLFAESCEYTVDTNFTQYIAVGPRGKPGGFTFEQFKSEIDAGRPVLIHVEGHTMLGYGYSTTSQTIEMRDTWDTSSHTMTWGGTYTGLQHYGVSVIRLAAAGPGYALTVSAAPTAGGTIAKFPNLSSYASGSVVTVTATPALGYAFASWSGAASGTANPTTITMDADKTVTAAFAVDTSTYALTVNVTGSGTVGKSPDQPSYLSGTVVTLTATPAAGYTFTGWSGGPTGSVNPATITMTSNKTVTATFTAIPTYTLTVTSSPSVGGSVAKSPDQPSYLSGTVVTLTAIPTTGYGFASWFGDRTGAANPTIITMDANKTVTATFATVDGEWIAANNGLWGGNVASLAIDPANSQVVYAGTGGGGVFKSTDGGSSWGAVNTGLTEPYVTSLAIDPTNTNIVYAGTSGGVFKSTNGSSNWTQTSMTRSNASSLVIDPTNTQVIYAAAGSIGVFKSTSGGTSWTQVSSGLTNAYIWALAIDPANTQVIYAAAWGTGSLGPCAVFKSTNGGSNWAQTSLTDTTVMFLVIDPTDTQVIYAGTTNSGVFKSTNGGTNWTQTNTGLFNHGVWSLAIDSTNPQVIYAGTVFGGGMFKSTNGGTNWTQMNTGLTDPVVLSLAIDPTNSQVIYAGTDSGGVFKSTSGGTSWTQMSSGMTNVVVSSLAIALTNTQVVYAGTSGGVFKSTNGGWNWTNTGLAGARVSSLVIDPTNTQVIYAGISGGAVGNAYGIFKSTNAGANWTQTSLTGTFVLSLAIDPTNTQTIYAGGSGGVFKSTDAGANWTPTGLADTTVRSVAVDPTNAQVVYAGAAYSGVWSGGRLFKSTDGGTNWSQTSLTGTVIFSLVIDLTNTQVVYAGTNGSGVFGGSCVLKSTDGGSSWTEPGLVANLVNSLALDPANTQVIYAGTWLGGVSMSTNGGSNWTQMNTGLTNTSVNSLAIDPTTTQIVYAGTSGSGVFKKIPSGTSPVLDHFDIATVGTQTAGVPFGITITAKDQYGATYAPFTSTVSLAVNKGSVTPGTTWNFVAGVLTSFSVTIPAANTGVILTVSSSGKTGTSNSFAVNPPRFTLTYTAGANGSITGTSPQTVNYGGSGTQVTAVPNLGSSFVKWSDDVMTASRTDTNVTANKTVTATFSLNTYTITPSAGAGGTITPSTPQIVSQGGNLTFTITPSTGYHIEDVLVDGSTVGALSSYPFTNVQASHTIAASFAPDAPAPDMGMHITSPLEGASLTGGTFTVAGTFDTSRSGTFKLVVTIPTIGTHTYLFTLPTPSLTWGPVTISRTDFPGLVSGATYSLTLQGVTELPSIPPCQTGLRTVTWQVQDTVSFSLPLLSSWNVIAVPFATPVSLLPTCDLFLAWDGSLWQMTTTLLPGTGYLVRNTAGATTVSLTGTPSSSPQTQPATGTWQIIGNPYTTPASVACTSSVPYLLSWDGSLWQLVSPTNLPPGLGFLLQSSSPGTITLTRLP